MVWEGGQPDPQFAAALRPNMQRGVGAPPLLERQRRPAIAGRDVRRQGTDLPCHPRSSASLWASSRLYSPDCAASTSSYGFGCGPVKSEQHGFRDGVNVMNSTRTSSGSNTFN